MIGGAERTLFSANCGSHLSRCSFVAYFRNMVFTRVLWTSHMTDTEGSTLASSSMAIMAEVNEEPEPPWSTLVSIAISWGQKETYKSGSEHSACHKSSLLAQTGP